MEFCQDNAPINYEANDSYDEDACINSYIDNAMNRGALLRQWKLLAQAEEEAANYDYSEEEKKEDQIKSNILNSKYEEIDQEYTIRCGATLESKKRVLRYEQYLKHQSYHDDYKHVNYDYIDFGLIIYNNRHINGDHTKRISDLNLNENEQIQRLVIGQDRKLGKGGLVWDAAFCLGEHLLQKERHEPWHGKTILELGAGTGMLGCWLGKALHDKYCHIMITDLPCLLDLMKQNVDLNNFISSTSSSCPNSVTNITREIQKQLGIYTDTENAKNYATTVVEPRVLTWGKKEEYPNATNCNSDENDSSKHKDGCSVDIIVGADIVASLYNPFALAQTLWELSTSNETRIYLSGKSRLDQPHLEFEESAKKLFHHFEKMPCTSSRNVNPNVFIIEIWGRKDEKDVKEELLKTRESTYHK